MSPIKYFIHSFVYLLAHIPLALQSIVHITLTASVNGIDPASKPGGIIVSVNGIHLGSKPGGIWVSTETYESHILGMAQGIYPLYLIPGYQAFGIMEVTQWMFINPSLLEMLGFSPVCKLIR